MKYSSILLLLIAIASGCVSRTHQREENVASGIDYQLDSIRIVEDPGVSTLNSYGLSAYCHTNECLYCYNYKEHSIDILDLSGGNVKKSIVLETQGPDAVMRELSWLDVYSPDTIVAYDFNSISVLDSIGHVQCRIKLLKDEWARIDCNSRSNISGFKLDFDNHTITYPVAKPDRNEIIVYDYIDNAVVNRIKLEDSDNKGDYGFMRFPNVSFHGGSIIYNYPYESTVFIYDSISGTTRKVSTKSSYHPDTAKEYEGNSPEDIGWYGAENVFYSPMYYLAEQECFVRITLGATSLDRSVNMDKAYYDRPIYVMKYDEKFTPVGEFELERHKYNPFGGWCAMYDCMAFFQDSMLKENDSDDIIIDTIVF